MTTVKLDWWDAAGRQQRELTVSHDCPKCLTVEAVLLCEAGSPVQDDACASCGIRSGHNPVRCSLCETEYARPWKPFKLRDPVDLSNSLERTIQACDEARARFERESEAEAERISKLPLDEQRRIWLETLAAYSPQPERMRSFFGLEQGELAEVYFPHASHSLRLKLPPERTLRRRVTDALRGLAAGWRGAL